MFTSVQVFYHSQVKITYLLTENLDLRVCLRIGADIVDLDHVSAVLIQTSYTQMDHSGLLKTPHTNIHALYCLQSNCVCQQHSHRYNSPEVEF